MSFELASGAEGRWTGPEGPKAVVCVNGGTAADRAGTWSASVEWLVRRLAPRWPALSFLEVRYRLRSWRRLDLCVEDARAGIASARERGAEEVALLGFSMGGAVAVQAAGDPAVSTVIALAPWLYPQLDVSPLDGRRFAIVHGALDRSLPGLPGVAPALSLAGYERARARGVDAARTLIPGGVHPIALRAPWGQPLPMARAGRWAELVGSELERFCA
jgi:alpha-beta hydrolase superfamily lysophospholipase